MPRFFAWPRPARPTTVAAHEGDDRHAHPGGVEARRVAVVGECVEADVECAVRCEVRCACEAAYELDALAADAEPS